MEIEGESLDDILMSLYRILPSTGTPNIGSRGETLELLGCQSACKFDPRLECAPGAGQVEVSEAAGRARIHCRGEPVRALEAA